MNRYAVRVKRRIYRQGKRMYIWEVVGHQNLPELEARLKPIMLKRFREVDVRWDSIQVGLRPDEMERYIRATEGALAVPRKEFAARLPDIQQVVDGSVVDALQLDAPTATYMEVKAAGLALNEGSQLSSKEQALLVYVTKVIQDMGTGCIIYSTFRKSLSRIRLLLKRHSKQVGHTKVWQITGDTSLAQREMVTKKFDSGHILLMTDAGGESLNLQAANTLVFYNLPWSIGKVTQVAGRIVRMDSVHPFMNIVVIEAVDTIDTYKTLLMYQHTDLITKLVGGDPNLPKDTMGVSKAAIYAFRQDLVKAATLKKRLRASK
jgi:hypothetical protein